MQISLAQSFKSLSFGQLPKRYYPYELPKGQYESQEEAQMPKTREEMKSLDSEYEKLAALYNLQNAIKEASPYLPEKSKRAQNSLLKHTNNLVDNMFPVRQKLMTHTLCCAQSAYQQDKHDAIYAFNIISANPNLSKENKGRLLYGMSGAFRDLDRSCDTLGILKAEDKLREYYNEQSSIEQDDLNELYGGGKNLNFKA